MRIFDLKLKNIGPFNEANLCFIGEEDNQQHPPVTIITGENGSGKTVILDAIRAALIGNYGKIERSIIKDTEDFEVSMTLNFRGRTERLKSSESGEDGRFKTNNKAFNGLFVNLPKQTSKDINWVASYWTSKLSTDSFKISSLSIPDADNYLVDTLSGIHTNIEVTQLICYFDYLRGSNSKSEAQAGEYLFNKLKEIINLSLNNGEFSHVARAQLEPIVKQYGQEIALDKLSSGNLYLVQRMVSLLGKMYSVHQIMKIPIEEICNTPAFLLIDEAENHLHPKWQKVFINNLYKIFPNLQIILTTHSPFLIVSVKNPRVYVCQSEGDHCIVKDVSAEYSNKPIEEVLISPLFGATYPFNQEITTLLQERKIAIKEGNKPKERQIENTLKAINPEYFSYLDVENLLGELTKVKK